MAGMSAEVDIKAWLGGADSIVDLLPWRLGATAARPRPGGCTGASGSRAAGRRVGARRGEGRPAAASGAAEAPDAGAQEKRWRAALKRAKSERRTPARTPPTSADSER
jgi:hypothetical protein